MSPEFVGDLRQRIAKLEPIDWMALTLLGGVLPSALYPEILQENRLRDDLRGDRTPGAGLNLRQQKAILYALCVPNQPDGSFDFVLYRQWVQAISLTDEVMLAMTQPLRERYM